VPGDDTPDRVAEAVRAALTQRLPHG